jgi:serine/threonine-protein kinase HipA
MYRAVELITVSAWGQTVGAVTLDPRLQYYAFEYTPEWRRTGIELSPLQMPLSDQPYVFPSLPEPTFKRLPALLADALPDDFGNALIDAYLAREGVPQGSITPLDRLAYLSNRGMGALEFKPARSPRKRATALELEGLVRASREALSGQFDGDREKQAAIANLIQVGTSAGGARAKAVIAWNPVSNEIRSGQLPADPGFEHWLIKFDGVGKDSELGTGGHYGRIEYAYYLMARAAKITMAPSRLLEENGRAHFMTKRFDRDGGVKHHMQTLCAMAHLDYKQRGSHDYGQLFLAIQGLELGDAALEQAFRRMVFNALAANFDDHTKNHSFLLKKGEGWALTPAYDVTHAYNPTGVWTFQHLMSIDGKFSDIKRKDLLAVADRFIVPGAKHVLDDVTAAVARWPEFANVAGLPVEEIERIRADHTTTFKAK